LIQAHSRSAAKTIVYGAFKSMGDLLSAAPVIAAQLNEGHYVLLLCFPSSSLTQFVDLIDFGPRRANLRVWPLPVSSGWAGFARFFSEAARLRPDLVWISPHASQAASSWKIPLLLWLTKKLHWPRTRIAGATTERLSFLFDDRVPVDRDLPRVARERLGFSMAAGTDTALIASPISFVRRITQAVTEPSKYDLLIHPGANAQNRSWP
jgi:heptosyltransferase II